jgi:hypothetical protein
MEHKTYLDRITLVSGGQTGIDRALLNFCLNHGIRCGGWCPAGRKAEDGPIDPRYPVKEYPGASYNQRTTANVIDSDATVIIFYREMQGGTLKSFECCRKEQKPFLLLDLSVMDVDQGASRLSKFLEHFQPATVNFSGPRQSDWAEGYTRCYTLLEQLFLHKRNPARRSERG